VNFAGRGTESIRGLGDSWDVISQTSNYLTADKGYYKLGAKLHSISNNIHLSLFACTTLRM